MSKKHSPARSISRQEVVTATSFIMSQEAQISSENVPESTSISATKKETREVITVLLLIISLYYFVVQLVPRHLLHFHHEPSVICLQLLCGVIHLTTFRSFSPLASSYFIFISLLLLGCFCSGAKRESYNSSARPVSFLTVCTRKSLELYKNAHSVSKYAREV